MEQEQPGQEGAITKLAQQVGEGLQKLSQVLADSGGSPEDQAQMKQILELYIDLVEKKLGGGESEPEPSMGQVPMQQGAGGVPMGPQVQN